MTNSQNSTPSMQVPLCPLPLRHDDTIMMGHGSGGRMTQDLIRRVFSDRFQNDALAEGNDFARLIPQNGRVSVSTDAHLVSPLFFPGGDLGRWAVCGTVNDVAMSGAVPLYLTASFIIEEGLPVSTLDAVAASMQSAAEEAGVQIVAGDTKVVEKGNADQLFISTTGIGWIPEGITTGGQFAKPGDVILISGSMGDHGIAVLSARGDLGFTTDVVSDTAPLNHMISSVIQAAPHVHVLRDPTRGGLATTLNEIAQQSQTSIWIDESAIPVQPSVRAACEMLGFDPLYIANEGKLIVIVPAAEADDALLAMRKSKYGGHAVKIGEVQDTSPGRVLLRTGFGSTRILDMLSGEMLPRIC